MQPTRRRRYTKYGETAPGLAFRELKEDGGGAPSPIAAIIEDDAATSGVGSSATPTRPGTTPYFTYGSISIHQLRERCRNTDLAALKASLPGHRRIFAGGSASLVKSESGVEIGGCAGFCVMLSEAEFELLDAHAGITPGEDPFARSGRYRREHVNCMIWSLGEASGKPLSSSSPDSDDLSSDDDDSSDSDDKATAKAAKAPKATKATNTGNFQAVAYIRNDHTWGAFPSEESLQACVRNTKVFWGGTRLFDGEAAGTIVVLDETGTRRGAWHEQPTPIVTSSTPLGRGSNTFLKRLANKGAYLNRAKVQANAASGETKNGAPGGDGGGATDEPPVPLWATLGVYDLSHIDMVASSFYIRYRVMTFFECGDAHLQDLQRAGLGHLVERAVQNGEHTRLSEEEVAAVIEAMKPWPMFEVYNSIEEPTVLDAMTVQVYAREGGQDVAIMCNVMYGQVCKEVFELNNFPFDVQHLTLDLRLVDTELHNKFNLVLNAVQFETNSLELSEFQVCEPLVERVNDRRTVVELKITRKAQFWVYVSLFCVRGCRRGAMWVCLCEDGVCS